MTKKQFINLLICFAVLAMLFGMWTHHNLKHSADKNLNLASATVLPQAKAINPFQLIDDHQQTFNNDNLKNHWTFIFFGFTNCPQLCPTTLAVLNQMYTQLVQNHITPMPQVLFISVDPEQDSPAQIHRYLQGFNANFVGATGTQEQLDALTQQFNVVYAKVFANGDQMHYSIDHSGTILLMNPAGQLYAIFSMPHDAGNLAKDYQKIVKNI